MIDCSSLFVPAFLLAMMPVVTPVLGTFTVMSSPAIRSPSRGVGVPTASTLTTTCRLPSYTRSTALTPVRPTSTMGRGVMLPVVLVVVVLSA